MPRRAYVIAAALLALTVTGCFLAPNREINLRVTRTATGGSEVTVTYRVPPPKAGNVYVLWIVNSDTGRQVRVGTIEASEKLRAVRTNVDFWATGAVVSIESTATPARMSDTWALVSGATGQGDQATDARAAR